MATPLSLARLSKTFVAFLASLGLIFGLALAFAHPGFAQTAEGDTQQGEIPVEAYIDNPDATESAAPGSPSPTATATEGPETDGPATDGPETEGPATTQPTDETSTQPAGTGDTGKTGGQDADKGFLASTGADIILWALLALAVIALGAGLVYMNRRGRKEA